MTHVDEYEPWRKLCRGEQVDIEESKPLVGFWRDLYGGELVGVAIWRNKDGHLQFRRGEQFVTQNTVWPRCVKRPTSEEMYRFWEQYHGWPDDVDITPERGIGDNAPADELETIRDEVESAIAAVDSFGVVDSDERSAAAQSLRSRILELGRKVKKTREEKVKPHLDAQRDVNAKWMPLQKSTQTAADTIRKAMEAWEAEKRRKAYEARMKAEAEAAEAAKRNESEKPVEPAPPPEEILTREIKGAYGRAASVSMKKVAVVTDQDAVYKHFAHSRDVQGLLTRLAQNAIDAGQDVPGIEIKEEPRVR